MKKIYIILILTSLLLLAGCVNERLEFPTYLEVNKVEMTEDEIGSLLDTIDIETELKKVFSLSMYIDMAYDQEFSNVAKVDFNVGIASHGFIKLKDESSDLEFYLDHTVTMKKEVANLVDKGFNEKTKLSGMLHTYFTNQQLYVEYDFDNDLDGKYKLNNQEDLGLDDQLFLNYKTMIDKYILTHTTQEKLIHFLLESDMIYVYEQDGKQSVYFDIDSNKISQNKDMFIDPMNYDELQYLTAKTEFIKEVTENQKLNIKLSLDIIDEKLDAINITFDQSFYHNGGSTNYDVVIILKTNAVMPLFPKDLDQYESVDELYDITI